MRRMKRVVIWMGMLALIGFGGTYAAQGCATCFGASDSPMAQGMNMGIISLLGVVGFVLAGVVAFFGYLAWRMNRMGGSDLTDELPMPDESRDSSWR